MDNILNEIKVERQRQEAKWGQQNHPILHQFEDDHYKDLVCIAYGIPTEEQAKQMVEIASEHNNLSYMQILIEEVSEAASCQKDIVSLRKELIQVAAVTVAMIESLDRNGR